MVKILCKIPNERINKALKFRLVFNGLLNSGKLGIFYQG
jgi:hypothetical protein